MNIKSIRVKLVLWYMLVLALTLSAFSVLLYHNFSKSMKSQSDAILRSKAEGIENSIETYWEAEKLDAIKDGVVVDKLSKINNVNFARIAQRLVGETSGEPQLFGIIVRIYGADGKLIARSKDYPNIPDLSGTLLREALRNNGSFETVDIEDSSSSKPVPVRIFSMPVREQGSVAYIVQVARQVSVTLSAVHRLGTMLVILVPFTVLLTGMVGIFLAKLALDPVDRIIETARKISAENMKMRIDIPDTKDEVKRLADTFNDMLGRLERAFISQRQFIEDLSHELKTPLAVMKGEMEVTLKKIRAPGEYEETLRSSLDEIETIIFIVENLLTLARFDNDAIIFRMQPLTAADVLDAPIRDAGIFAAKKSISIAAYGRNGGAGIIADRDQMRRVFLNLLDNAVKYTPEGGRVSVDIAESGGFVKISVSDTGMGIPADEIPRIFERFYRVDKSRGSAGFGLGLSIAKSIVEAHKGRIEVSGLPGNGATFSVLLPKH